MQPRGRAGSAQPRCPDAHWAHLQQVWGMPSALGSGPALRKDALLLPFSLHWPWQSTGAQTSQGCVLSSPEPLHLEGRGLACTEGT